MSENPQNDDVADALRKMAPPQAQPQPKKPAPTPPPKKERPLAPTRASAHVDQTDGSMGLSGMRIVDDDDAVHIPDLAPEGLTSMSRYGALQPKAPGPARSLLFRRTMIPILLTCGVMLPTLAGLWFLTDPDHVVRGTGTWLPVTFIVLGAVFLLLAVVNMAQVKHILSDGHRASPPR